jgi:hypothetical protein
MKIMRIRSPRPLGKICYLAPGRLGVIDPEFRGRSIGSLFGPIAYAISKTLKLEVMYFFATLQHKYTQIIFEKHGFQPIGIVPAFDLDAFPKKGVKRVPEVLYAKVLCPKERVFVPKHDTMTPQVQRLWKFLKQ